MRAFIFSVWVHVGKTSAATIAALETLAGKQFTTAEQGGRYVVSATVQGKSFTYEMPEGTSGSNFLEMVRESWRMLNLGGTISEEMNDAELKAYLLDADGEVTDRTVASFTRCVDYGC
tara:strand:- start:3605 stop:3958 length:354 start_codon:yes stop_codon:yes gene_type:complete